MIAPSHPRLGDIAAADVAGAARVAGVEETERVPGIGSPLQSLQPASIVTLAMFETWRGVAAARHRVLWRSARDTSRRWLGDEFGDRPVIVALARPGTPPVDFRDAFLDTLAVARRQGTLDAESAGRGDEELLEVHSQFRPVADPEGGELMEFVCRIDQVQPWIVQRDDETERFVKAALAGDAEQDEDRR